MNADAPADNDAPKAKVGSARSPRRSGRHAASIENRTPESGGEEFITKPVVEAEPPRTSIFARIDRPFVFGFLVTLGGLAAFVFGLALSNLSTVLIYIALSLFLALGLDPAVRLLERRGMSRAWAVLVAFLALLAVLAVVLSTILPTVITQVASFVQSVPTMIHDFQQSHLFLLLQDRFGDQIDTIVKDLQNFLTNPGNIATITGGALKVGMSIANAISGAVIVLVLTLYFVATLPTIKKAMLNLVAARDRKNTAILTDQITNSVGGYVMGMVILAFANAVVVFLTFLLLGLAFPLLMATVAFCVTLIPLVGSLLFWVIGSVLALFQDPLAALIFAVIYIIYMQVEAYVLTPRVMNRTISIPGSLVVIGALVGGTLLGLLGALVAVPVTASILIIVKKVWIPRQNARV